MKKIIFILILCLLIFSGCYKKSYPRMNSLKFDYSEQIQKNVSLKEFSENFLSMRNKLDYKCDLPIFVENNGDCGYIKVPKDYKDVNKGHYNIFWYVFKANNQENKKDPIVLLPGGPGISGTWRANVILSTGVGKLRENHDIYSIDYRGVGLSDPYSKEIYENCEYVDWLGGDKKGSMLNTVNNCKKYLDENENVYIAINYETVGKDIIEFLENKKIDKAILYGQSAGTLTALISTKISPKRISGLVLDGTISYDLGGKNQKKDAFLFGISEFLKSYEKNRNSVPKEFSNFNKRIISLSKKANKKNKEFAYKVLRTISIFSQDKYRFVITDKVLTMFENNDIESFSNFSENIAMKYNIDYQDDNFGSEYEFNLFFYRPQGIYFFNRVWNRMLNQEKINLVNTKNLDERILNFIQRYEGTDLMIASRKVEKIMDFSYLPFDDKYKTENINVPTLILSGTRDTQTPVPWATFVDSKLSNSKQFILQNGVHVLTRVNNCGVELMKKFSLNPEDIQNVNDSCVSEINDFHNEISYDILEFEKLLE